MKQTCTFKKFIKSPESFTHVYLYNQRITDEMCALLSTALNLADKLQRLILNNNKIGNTGATLLANGLKNHLVDLTYIDLGSNLIGDEGAKSLSLSLQHQKNLKLLALGCNKIEDAGAQSLADAMQKIKHFKHLYLYNNHISSTMVSQLMSELDTNRSLHLKCQTEKLRHYVQKHWMIQRV